MGGRYCKMGAVEEWGVDDPDAVMDRAIAAFGRGRERDRQRDRETERQRDRETERQRQRQRDRETETETETERQRQRDRLPAPPTFPSMHPCGPRAERPNRPGINLG